MTQGEAQTPNQSNVTDAANGFAHATTTGSPSPAASSSTLVESGPITATPWSEKKTPKRERYEEYMVRMLREEESRMKKPTLVSSSDDLVNSPSHYNQYGIECKDAIRAMLGPEGWESYCQGNVMKYLWRWRYKNGLQDLEKADVYLRWLMEQVEESET